MSTLRIQGTRCAIRRWLAADASSMAKHANNRLIWQNLRDHFPHPYSLENAKQYLGTVVDAAEPNSYAIEVNGEAVGGISAHRLTDIHRLTAEIGYWLGEDHWGAGVMTEAVTMFTDALLEGTLWEDQGPLTRVFATPFSENPASGRVLEKAGFRLEGKLAKSVIKDGVVLDQWMYARVS